MKVKIIPDISPAVILKSRGLGESHEAQMFLAQTVANLSDPYIPMSAGSGAHMKNNYTIAEDGSSITYHSPHAHFQYVGEVMEGIQSRSPWAKSGEPKRYTGRPINYHGAPMRGKQWDKRMMADRGGEVAEALAKKVGGTVK